MVVGRSAELRIQARTRFQDSESISYCWSSFAMGYSHTLSRGRMGFLPREHHAPEAHRAQLQGQGGMMLEGGENPFCRGTGVRITFSYSKADL